MFLKKVQFNASEQHKITFHLATDSYNLQRENLFLISSVEYFPIGMGVQVAAVLLIGSEPKKTMGNQP